MSMPPCRAPPSSIKSRCARWMARVRSRWFCSIPPTRSRKSPSARSGPFWWTWRKRCPPTNCWRSGCSTRKGREAAFRPLPGKTSTIMETLQRIAVERFTGRAAEDVPKSLVVISDMLQHGPDYSPYSGDLSFGRFKTSRAYKKVQTDLHGADVLIYYIQRQAGKPINSADHIRFWADWIRDNHGRLKQASKLQGVG